MALKNFKPVTPSLRQLVIVDRSELYKGKPLKVLTEGKSSSGGRNNLGRVTVRFRGGGHKRTLRLIDFKRRGKDGIPAVVERLAPVRERALELLADPAELDRILASGAEKARAVATPVLEDVYAKVGFLPPLR